MHSRLAGTYDGQRRNTAKPCASCSTTSKTRSSAPGIGPAGAKSSLPVEIGNHQRSKQSPRRDQEAWTAESRRGARVRVATFLQLKAIRVLQAQGFPPSRIQQLLFGRSGEELQRIVASVGKLIARIALSVFMPQYRRKRLVKQKKAEGFGPGCGGRYRSGFGCFPNIAATH